MTLLVLQSSFLFGQDNVREIVAILPFEARGLSADESIQMRERFIEAFGESSRFEVLAASSFGSALEQAGFTTFDSCTSQPCLGRLGVTLGVPKVVHVSVDRWGNKFVVHTRLVRSSDSALLYDERVDFTGEYETLLSTVLPEQGGKLSMAHLDEETNWLLLVAVACFGIGMISLIFVYFTKSGQRVNPIEDRTLRVTGEG
ncbi:MAG: hypothetical protein ABIH23_06145 [bacterium]